MMENPFGFAGFMLFMFIILVVVYSGVMWYGISNYYIKEGFCIDKMNSEDATFEKIDDNKINCCVSQQFRESERPNAPWKEHKLCRGFIYKED